jgi:hypothetical protein
VQVLNPYRNRVKEEHMKTSENTTAMQSQLLDQLRAETRVWSVNELAEAVAEELGEPSSEAPATKLEAAVEGLVEGGLVHSLGDGLVSISRRGLIADPGGATLEPSEGGIGVFNVQADGRELLGGAENLAGGLVPLGGSDGIAGLRT